MRGFLLVVFLVFADVLVAAETVPVRSGEHDQFTRLVFTLPARSDYALQQNGRVAVLRIDQAPLEIDLESIFDRIPRGRLQGISFSYETQETILNLACECRVSSFWFRDSFLVLDIADDTEATKVELADSLRATWRDRLPNRVSLQHVPRRTLALLDPFLRQGNPPSTAAELVDSSLERGHVTVDSPLLSTDNDLRLEEKRLGLIETLKRSDTQGVVTFQTTDRDETTLAVEDTRSLRQSAAKPQDSEIGPLSSLPAQINVRVSEDKAESPGQARLHASDSRELRKCLAPADVDVANWGGARPFWEEIGSLRRSLYGEFDRLDTSVAFQLSRTYLHYGFGAEALETLSLMDGESEEKALLIALADIMDQGQTSSDLFDDQLNCPEPVSLWAMFSGEHLNGTAGLNSDAILRGFSGLPPHLRSHLGPMLSERFLGPQRPNESDVVLRVLALMDETQTSQSDLAQAELDMAFGEEDTAQAGYLKVIEDNTASSFDALIRHIEMTIASGDEVSSEKAELAGSYAFEYRDQPEGPRIASAYILALGASGRFEEAYATLAGEYERLPDSGRVTRVALASLLVERADDVSVLMRYFAGDLGAPEDLSDETLLALSRRLFSEGFFDAADQELQRGFVAPLNRSARLLRAEIALERGLPRAAELHLLGVDGEEADGLRTWAQEITKNLARSEENPGVTDLRDTTADQDWLASEQTAVAQDGQSIETVETSSTPSLELNRALLDGSVEARTRFDDLLFQNPMPQAE